MWKAKLEGKLAPKSWPDAPTLSRPAFSSRVLGIDPSLRGIMDTLSQAMQGVKLKQASLDDLDRPIALIADALARSATSEDIAFSWRTLIAGRPPEGAELRRMLLLRPVLDFTDLQPGGKATAFIRDSVQALALTPDHGVRVRLTGPIPLADEEFGTIAEGMEADIVAVAGNPLEDITAVRKVVFVMRAGHVYKSVR